MINKKIPLLTLATLLAFSLLPAQSLHAHDGSKGYLRLDYWDFGSSGDAMVKGVHSKIEDGNKTINGDDWGMVLGGEFFFDTWGLNMDLMFARQSTTQKLSDAETANWWAEYYILTFGGMLPMFQTESEGDQTVGLDGFAGLRSYSNAYKLEFEPYNSSNNQDKAGYKSWIDPYIGLRLNGRLNERWAMELYGDAGGFGVGQASELSVLGRAALIFTVTEGFNINAGYRLFNLESSNQDGDKQTQVDLQMEGITLGLECRFQ